MQNENVGFWAKSNNKVPLKVPKLKAFFLLPMVLAPSTCYGILYLLFNVILGKENFKF